ncbi:hypothetical protein SO802_010587 [Lithocarpus litseifolius]|uniref:Protein kinase domain-containing protein n=1 Tax=Lithocarpus litseifolius TaxID=425828 RepID=A0AAW2DIT5_9ROSI
MVVRTVFQILLLVGSINTVVKGASIAKDSCQAQCGDVDIPYPFGIEAGCYINDWFAIDCNNQSAVASFPKPFLKSFKLEVLNISLQHGTVRVNYPIFSICANEYLAKEDKAPSTKAVGRWEDRCSEKIQDDKYRAKIADFETSRSITIDQTHLTTVVQGTSGYLDLEYFQSSQFTEKSDVYSFGVVLTELLTGEKAISSTRTLENKSLATYFIHSMEENNLFNIIDARIMKDAKKEEIIAVANLAKMCLNLSGKKRPTMKEVATGNSNVTKSS